VTFCGCRFAETLFGQTDKDSGLSLRRSIKSHFAICWSILHASQVHEKSGIDIPGGGLSARDGSLGRDSDRLSFLFSKDGPRYVGMLATMSLMVSSYFWKV